MLLDLAVAVGDYRDVALPVGVAEVGTGLAVEVAAREVDLRQAVALEDEVAAVAPLTNLDGTFRPGHHRVGRHRLNLARRVGSVIDMRFVAVRDRSRERQMVIGCPRDSARRVRVKQTRAVPAIRGRPAARSAQRETSAAHKVLTAGLGRNLVQQHPVPAVAQAVHHAVALGYQLAAIGRHRADTVTHGRQRCANRVILTRQACEIIG